MRHRNALSAFVVLVLLAGVSLLSLYLLQPPKAKPLDAASNTFSAARAMRHVRQIAQEPHAMGTVAHARVRRYLLEQIQTLKLQPHVQEANAINTTDGITNVGHVYNLVGRLSGQQASNRQAILLVAHYDSQPNTLGAGDDGAGVAALLETARALQHGPPLQHDVIFLLTDGEEYGLYGARAFLAHPWAKQVALVLNLEARGNSGPSMTFEMNQQNGWVSAQYVAAAPYPFVSSLAYEIYSRMPNSTDFTVFKEAGYTGLNAAFIDGFIHYHKLTDSPENLNQNSLQQHGSNLLALTQHFGNMPLVHTKAPDAVFFNLAGNWVLHYQKDLNILWMGLTTLLFVVTLVVGTRRGAYTLQQVAIGCLLYLLLLVIVAGLFIPINKLVLRLLPYAHAFNGVYKPDAFLVAYLLLALGLFLLPSRVVLRWLHVFPLLMGAGVVWFILVVALLLVAPAASYLFLFPLLFVLGGALVILLLRLQHQPNTMRYIMVWLLAVVPAVFLLLPIVQVVFVAFSLQLPLAMVALFGLLLGLLLPVLTFIEQGLRWRGIPVLALALIGLGSISAAWAVAQQQPTATNPLHSHVSYFLDADAGQALWVSAFAQTDTWNQQFFPHPTTGALSEIYPIATRPYLKNSAQVLPLAAPVAEVLHDSVIGNARVLQLRLFSPRGAAHFELAIQPQHPTDLLSIQLNKEFLPLQPLVTGAEPLYFVRLHGLPPSKEATLLLRLKAGKNVRLLLYDHSIGLPSTLLKQPRPASVIPEQGRDSNLTVVRKSYTF